MIFILRKTLFIFLLFVFSFFLTFFSTKSYAQEACPEIGIGLNAKPFAERINPDPLTGGFSNCLYNGELYSYCPGGGYITGPGYCVDLSVWASAQGNCCNSDQTSCTNSDGDTGYCVGIGSSPDATSCDSGRACVGAPPDLDTSDPGSVSCSCRIGQGGLWYCSESGFNSTGCAPWASIDQTQCGSGIARPSWCDRDTCMGTVSCISTISDTGQPLKGHNEECTWSPGSDECDTSIGLQCMTVEGTYRCVYGIGTRGGPGGNGNSCMYDFECITEFGLETDPSWDYECTGAPGVLCDPLIHDSCTCTAPEGTWRNGVPVSTRPSTTSYDICASNVGNNDTAYQACDACMGNNGVWTSIGCISQEPKSLVGKLINIGIGILGGIFLLRVLAAAFMLTSSQGDVKKTSEAKQMITEAIIGIFFVLFSVTILQFIGGDVLKLPGFGG
ncbi:MAG: hypothetical protein OEX81_02940 [Candidatus Pacebacteria bacterium]|nr:hypothetical protein [Candidatus Paceibacterota bacterium]